MEAKIPTLAKTARMGHPTVHTPRVRCHKVKGKRRRSLISAIPKIFRIEVRGVWRGHIRGDEHDALPRKLETFPALAARDQFIDTNHVRPRERESLLVLFARAAWQLALLRSDNPSNRVIVFLAARRTCEGNALGVLLFGIELAFVHDVAAPSVPAIDGAGAGSTRRRQSASATWSPPELICAAPEPNRLPRANRL